MGFCVGGLQNVNRAVKKEIGHLGDAKSGTRVWREAWKLGDDNLDLLHNFP